jgi:hypothetical protein
VLGHGTTPVPSAQHTLLGYPKGSQPRRTIGLLIYKKLKERTSPILLEPSNLIEEDL